MEIFREWKEYFLSDYLTHNAFACLLDIAGRCVQNIYSSTNDYMALYGKYNIIKSSYKWRITLYYKFLPIDRISMYNIKSLKVCFKLPPQERLLKILEWHLHYHLFETISLETQNYHPILACCWFTEYGSLI